MIQVKFFKMEDWKECNDFMKKTRPRGEKGFVTNAQGFIVVYEEGEPMDKLEKLNKLRFMLGEHREKILTYQKESLISEALQEEYLSRPADEVNDYQKKKYKESNEAELIAKRKMILIEKLSETAVLELIEKTRQEGQDEK